jgi:hypothetical protein
VRSLVSACTGVQGEEPGGHLTGGVGIADPAVALVLEALTARSGVHLCASALDW